MNMLRFDLWPEAMRHVLDRWRRSGYFWCSRPTKFHTALSPEATHVFNCGFTFRYTQIYLGPTILTYRRLELDYIRLGTGSVSSQSAWSWSIEMYPLTV